MNRLLSKQGKIDEALIHLHNLQRIIRKNEFQLQLTQIEVEVLIEQNRYEDALKLIDYTIQKYPDNTDLLSNHAILADKIGNFEQCEKDLRRILEIDPNHINALNLLGYTLAGRTDRYQDAYDLLKQVYDLEPENSYILDSFGGVLYKMGKNRESLEYLHKAYAKSDEMTPEAAAETAVHLRPSPLAKWQQIQSYT